MSTQDLAPAADADLGSGSAGIAASSRTVVATPVEATPAGGVAVQDAAVLELDELLVEEISIDGMCGVY